MRRFQALLITAGLVAAPTGAAAGPTDEQDTGDRSVELFEWSMGKGRLGLTVMGLTPELRTHFGSTSQSGMLVGSVEPGSPASKAGVHVGDVIVETNGRLVDAVDDIRSAMANSKKGDTVEIDVIRDRKALTLKVTLVDDPSPMPDLDSFWHRDWFRNFMKSFSDEMKRPRNPAPTET
jgi:membrane-associated protease RseP (regulator of RpoE activity)